MTPKPGYKTTEFWITILSQLFGILAAAGFITPDQAGALGQAAIQLGGLVVLVGGAFGYSISRGQAKTSRPNPADGRSGFARFTTLAIIFLICFTFALGGCSTARLKPLNPFDDPPPDQPCTIYEDYNIQTGLIKQRIKNPCAAQNLLVTVAKGGVAFSAYDIDQFNKWADKAELVVKSNITYADLQIWITAEVVKLNKKFGMVVFAVSDIVSVFPDTAIIDPDDQKLILASIADLRAEIAKMAIFFGFIKYSYII